MKSFTTQFFFPSPDEQDRPGSISFSGTSSQTVIDQPGDGKRLMEISSKVFAYVSDNQNKYTSCFARGIPVVPVQYGVD